MRGAGRGMKRMHARSDRIYAVRCRGHPMNRVTTAPYVASRRRRSAAPGAAFASLLRFEDEAGFAVQVDAAGGVGAVAVVERDGLLEDVGVFALVLDAAGRRPRVRYQPRGASPRFAGPRSPISRGALAPGS